MDCDIDMITFAQPYPDARSDKIARGLSLQGIDVRRFLIDFDATWRTNFSVGEFEGTYRLPEFLRHHYYMSSLTGLETHLLRKIMRRLPGAVVRTSTPDTLGHAATQTSKNVVAEVYDTWSLYEVAHSRALRDRVKQIVGYRSERIVHENADLVVYTTEEMLAYARERYSIAKALVVPNAVLSSDLPKNPMPKLSEDGRSHCVYVGLVHPESEGKSRSIVPFLREIAREHVVHVYGVVERASRELVLGDVKGIVQWHDPIPQAQLLKELTQYDFGLILLPETAARRFHTVVPNKMYEYVATGIPVLVSPFRAMAKFVRTYNCGAVYDEGLPRGHVAPRTEFLLDTYLIQYAAEIRKMESS